LIRTSVNVDVLELVKKYVLFSKILPEITKCSDIIYLATNEIMRLSGNFVVYSGKVAINDSIYSDGQEFNVNDTEVKALTEALILKVKDNCTSISELESILPILNIEATIDELMSRPLYVSPSTPTIEAVKIMNHHGLSAILVVDDYERPIGIFTDTDLRRVVAQNQDLSRPIIEYASKPVHTVRQGISIIEALLEIISKGVRHLVIINSKERAIGIVTVRDIAYSLGIYPYYTLRQVQKSTSMEELSRIYRKLSTWSKNIALKMLDPESPNPYYLTLMVTKVTDLIVKKCIEHVISSLKEPPCNFVVAVSGSEGRFEQFVKTDMDGLIIYEDDTYSHYFQDFAKKLMNNLTSIGYPSCKANFSFDKQVYSLNEILERIVKYCRDIDSKKVIFLSLIQDARPVHGDEDIMRKIFNTLFNEVQKVSKLILTYFTIFKPQLSIFRTLPKKLKVKEHIFAPIVITIKGLSLIHNVNVHNTLERIRKLIDLKVLPQSLGNDLEWGYINALRILLWAKARGADEVHRNEIPTTQLKNVIDVARRLIEYVGVHYGL